MDAQEKITPTHTIPFDECINMAADITDLRLPLIRQYLYTVSHTLLKDFENRSLEVIAADMRIISGFQDSCKPLNVGLLFFNENPEKFFPNSRIEVVNIPYSDERTFAGPLDQQLRDALLYIKNNVIVEKVFKIEGKAESVRIKNYSYDALEEFVSNAIYHRSYQSYEPVTIRIEKDKIEITSTPGPDRSIRDEDIAGLRMKSERYKNKRIGDFLKELHLVRGGNTGISIALEAIQNNGSPLPEFVTDEERSFFSVAVPINKCFQ